MADLSELSISSPKESISELIYYYSTIYILNNSGGLI